MYQKIKDESIPTSIKEIYSDERISKEDVAPRVVYIPSTRILLKIMRSCAAVTALRRNHKQRIDHPVWWVKELSYLDILEGNQLFQAAEKEIMKSNTS